ncbi:uncharacterized protein TM35_001141040, partial [Trypanosoma theileri]
AAPGSHDSHPSYGMSLLNQRDDLSSVRPGGTKAPGSTMEIQGVNGLPGADIKNGNRPVVTNSVTKGESGVLNRNEMDGEQKVMEQKLGNTLEVQRTLNASKPGTVLSSSPPVQDHSGDQTDVLSEQAKNTQKQPVSSESGERRTQGQQEQIKETTQGTQQDDHNTETNATGTTSTESHFTADSKPHPTTDATPSEITQSGLSIDDSNTLNNTSTEPNSTTDNVTTAENESTNGVDTVGASAEGKTTATTISVTLNTTSNEDSTSPATNTSTIPPVPEISNNTIMPNVRGDADSSGISSVWVRVPLLIVVTLTCILVC